MGNLLGRSWAIIIALVVTGALSATEASAQTRVSLQVFYDELQPYGTWMDYGAHGYVWVPRVEPGFMPYGTNGHWIHTEYGNTWVSDYSWGWAPFHYGRWLFDDFYGWLWVPDTEWGPAWVAWRSGGGYYGWAPLAPGLGIHVSVQHYNAIPRRHWNFVPYRYVTYRHVYRHCVPHTTVVNVYHQTTIINNNYVDNSNRRYFSGPSRSEIEKRGGGRVAVHSVNTTDRPGRTEISRNTANFYRPEIDNTRESRSRAIPSTYVKRTEDGKTEKVITRTSRPSSRPVTGSEQIRKEDANNSNSGISRKAMEQGRFSPTREAQRSEYTPQRQPEQRTAPRSYQKIERAPAHNPRDRYEAPPVQRTPANRELQRTNNTRPREWQEQKQSIPRQPAQRAPQSNVRRGSVEQSQRSMQFRKSDGGGSQRQPAGNTGGSRSSDFRKRN